VDKSRALPLVEKIKRSERHIEGLQGRVDSAAQRYGYRVDIANPGPSRGRGLSGSQSAASAAQGSRSVQFPAEDLYDSLRAAQRRQARIGLGQGI
jgi:hypothetical protein